MRVHFAIVATLCGLALAAASTAAAAGTVGTTFPAGFPVLSDASLGTPVLGFGAAGPVVHTPVIFLHGNNDTPYPTTCNPFGDVQSFAQYFADHGYSTSELWALGYQGDQCDLLADQTTRSGIQHSTLANVPDLRAFVHAVLDYTGAKQVDIVGHSLGVTLAREWMREDHASRLVRRFVAIDGPNHGIVDCSPSLANYWRLPALGGFTPAERDLPGVRLTRHAIPLAAQPRQRDAGVDPHPRDPQRRHELRVLLGAGRFHRARAR